MKYLEIFKCLYFIFSANNNGINDGNEAKCDDVIDESNDFVADCKKYYMEYLKMSHGIVVLKCIDHGEIIGYHVMNSPESPNDYFSIITMIYIKPPKFVLCDIACQMQKYCMTREPDLFKDTIFLNDQMHGNNHKCGVYFNVKSYKHLGMELAGLNDPSIEQSNRILGRIKVHACWMKLSTLCKYLDILIEIENRKARRKHAGWKLF